MPLCCCGLLATDDYVTDQRPVIGYWFMLGSKVAIFNTTLDGDDIIKLVTFNYQYG